MNRFVHQLYDLGRILSFCSLLLGQLRFMHFSHERNTGQMLTETIMQVLPDSPLFARAYIEDRLFQVLSFGDVDTGSDDVMGTLSHARKQRTRPCNQPLIAMPGYP